MTALGVCLDYLLYYDITPLKSFSTSHGVRDFGVRCCFAPINHRSIATQTDVCNASPCEVAYTTSGIGISSSVKTETNAPKHAEWKVSHNHYYTMNAPPKVIFLTYDDSSFKAIPFTLQMLLILVTKVMQMVTLILTWVMKTWTPAGSYLMPNSSYQMMTWRWNHLKMTLKSPLLTRRKKNSGLWFMAF